MEEDPASELEDEDEDAGLPNVDGSGLSAMDSSHGDLGECVVCDEALINSNTPNRRITLSCQHEPDVCLDCLARSITVQFESKVWDNIDCPSCGDRLAFEDVQAFGTAETFSRYVSHNRKPLPITLLKSYSYDELATSEAMSSIPGFRRCLAPGCVSGHIHEGGADQPIVTCSNCASKSCFTHQTAWHAEETCEAFDERMAEERREEEAANAAYMEANTERCPNEKCQKPIEKNGGCQHMRCKLPPTPPPPLFLVVFALPTPSLCEFQTDSTEHTDAEPRLPMWPSILLGLLWRLGSFWLLYSCAM